MVLLATVILPHGAMPFDGNPDSESPACRNRYKQLDPQLRDCLSELYEGVCSAGKQIAELEPDLVILNSPHGHCLTDSLGIYLNGVATGNALWNNEWSEFSATAKIDLVRSKELKSFWELHGLPVQGLCSFGGLECKLRWGEVIPLWYLQKYMTKEAKYIITTNDLRPRSSTIDERRLNAGAKLAEFVANLPEKVVIAISGDLAHYHPTDCANPLYQPDPSMAMSTNKEASEAYEKALTAWVWGHQSVESSVNRLWDPAAALNHLSAAIAQDPYAYACGSKGFQMLHGLMAEESANGAKFTPRVIVHRVPTYYGMMAATFLRH